MTRTPPTLSEVIQSSRLLVIDVDPAAGRLRVRGVDDACSELSCREQTVVVDGEVDNAGLGSLHPGDIIKVESPDGRPEKIVVLRRAWEEWASPEL